MWYIKAEVQQLQEHARQDDRGVWCCKKSGTPIGTATTGRSIHTGIFPGAGAGEVREVVHLNCSVCYPNKRPPDYGTPITESDLIEL